MPITVISGFKTRVQTELNKFFVHFANQDNLTREACAQAYSKANAGERQMSFEHLHKLNAADLLVLDRGYPAQWLIAHLIQRHPKPHR
jgi:hypothetical protein